MRQIFKYTLVPGPLTILTLSSSAEFLSAGVQGDDIVVWVAFDPDDDHQTNFKVIIVPTGVIFDNEKDYNFIQTVFVDRFVFHIFVRELA
jgi:hypothetical protein